MLTAIIHARAEPMALSATLGPLVRGVVEGIIGAAILIAPEEDADTATIADASGCRVLIEADWAIGFARAVTNSGGAGVLVLDAGIQLGPEFWPLLSDRIGALGNRPAASRPALSPGLGGFVGGLTRALLNFGGKSGRDAALLLPPARAREIAQAKADPFSIRYGRELVRLNTGVTRVGFD